ncbi:MAG TPA: aquaporin, partial [Microthrixaceae bacterium]|nr:aquaporin [Microthrixaceae bacterium]
MNDNSRVFIAELVGTAILVIGGCGTAVFASDVVGTLGVATAFGLSLLVLAYALGGISGCHVNPAVTLGMYLGGKIEAGMLLIYWGAQLIGGLIGGLILWGTFQLDDRALPAGFASNGFDDHSPQLWNLGAVALVEIVMTALLIMVVLSTTHLNFPIGFGGIAAGVTLWLIHLISIP